MESNEYITNKKETLDMDHPITINSSTELRAMFDKRIHELYAILYEKPYCIEKSQFHSLNTLTYSNYLISSSEG